VVETFFWKLTSNEKSRFVIWERVYDMRLFIYKGLRLTTVVLISALLIWSVGCSGVVGYDTTSTAEKPSQQAATNISEQTAMPTAQTLEQQPSSQTAVAIDDLPNPAATIEELYDSPEWTASQLKDLVAKEFDQSIYIAPDKGYTESVEILNDTEVAVLLKRYSKDGEVERSAIVGN
jgi:hypothetical protein